MAVVDGPEVLETHLCMQVVQVQEDVGADPEDGVSSTNWLHFAVGG